MNPTESLSQGLQIGGKAVNLHPVIDGFRVLLFTFWMNSFAFPWKKIFLIYNLPLYSERFIQYISSEVIIVFHSSFKTIFNGILKSLTYNCRMKCFSQRFSSTFSIILFVVLHPLIRKSSPFHFFSLF